MSPLLITIASVLVASGLVLWAQALFRTSKWPPGKSRDDEPTIRAGRRGEREVRVHVSPASSSKRTRKVEVQLLPEEQGMRVQARTDYLANVDTGDPAFDHDVSVMGDEARALSVLTSATRERLRDRVLNAGLLVHGDRLFLEFEDESIQDATLLDEAVALAERLDDCDGERELSRRLATLARKDPVDGFRARCLDVLARDLPTSKVAVAKMQEFLDDPHPPVRVAALRWVVKHGGEELRAATLAAVLGGERSIAEHEVALGALDSGQDARHVPAVLRLVTVPNARVVSAALPALERVGAPFPEESLIAHLDTKDASLRGFVVQALGERGSVIAVEPLLALTRGLVFTPGLVELARDAARRIQSRLGDVEHGRISLAPQDGQLGGLSVVASDDGALSLAEANPPARDRSRD